MYAEDVQHLDKNSILEAEVFIALLEEESEILKNELEEALQARAKALGVKTAFNKRLMAYKKDLKKINQQNQGVIQGANYGFSLKLSSKGNVVNCSENYLTILRNDPKYKGRLLLNEFTKGIVYVEADGKKREWRDIDDSEARCYIETTYGIHGEKKLNDALNIIFQENSYHPIKQIIEGATWDGVSRIEQMLSKWLGAVDDAYTREVSRLIFAGGINRLYEPGCKYDEMAVLIGKNQGEGKSTFVSWLALDDEFFREVKEIEGQKGIEALEGGWICEMGELLALTKAKEVEAVKAYITCREDSYRRPFEKRTAKYKRHCIFVGTTNREEFLTDKTGNRRFYPVVCNSKGYELFNHKEEIQADILQCWTEAKALYDKGQLPAFAKVELLDEIKERQAQAVEDDYREGLIDTYLEKRDEVCIMEIWEIALGNPYSKPTRKDSNEIATMLNKRKDWMKSEQPMVMGKYGKQRYWTKIKASSMLVPNQLSPESIEQQSL